MKRMVVFRIFISICIGIITAISASATILSDTFPDELLTRCLFAFLAIMFLWVFVETILKNPPSLKFWRDSRMIHAMQDNTATHY
ncbi:unnamed protein product [Auanema sp. JU1783]|nr:unnamed protein product [Auanema sp. JU1783]